MFFRSSIEGVKINGWQVEVAPPNNHTGGVYESYGRGWLVKPKPEDEKWLKEGKWNTMKIVVLNDRVTTWLNGHQMIDIADAKIGAGKGFIALQILTAALKCAEGYNIEGIITCRPDND